MTAPRSSLAATLALTTAMLGLTACESKVYVSAPTIAVTELGTGAKTPGRYAVSIETGHWNTAVKAEGYACSAWTFPVQLDQPYLGAAQAAFSQSFEAVTVASAVLSPEQLASQSYDGQIVIRQGRADARFSAISGVFSGTMTASINLDGTVSVVGPNGQSREVNVHGHGEAGDEAYLMCDEVAGSIVRASAASMKDFILDVVTKAKLAILELKLARTAAN